jgi:hypothetical protein
MAVARKITRQEIIWVGVSKCPLAYGAKTAVNKDQNGAEAFIPSLRLTKNSS